jgi:uncharacterized small protein (TIGR04563 family)
MKERRDRLRLGGFLEGATAGATSIRVHVERRGENVDAWRDRRSRVSPDGPDRRKQSLYFPQSMLKEMADEAARQDRSLSWLVQKAWKLAREQIKRVPAATPPGDS